MTVVAGVDEAGRGALAGPVVAAAVILDPMDKTPYFDSKALSVSKRSSLFEKLRQTNASISIGIVSRRHIDRINILQSSLLAMAKAVRHLGIVPDEVWVDGNQIPKQIKVPVKAIVKGDQSILCISAASIVAKVVRDELMHRYEARYPGYGFLRHKGYGTQYHRTAILNLGRSPIHRLTFSVAGPGN